MFEGIDLMAQFDMSETVNNILSSRGDAIQGLVGDVTGAVGGLTGLPGGGFPKLPGQGGAPAASQPAQRSQFNPFNLVAARGAVNMASKLMKIADEAEGDGLDVAIGATALLGEMLGEASGLVGDLVGNLATAARAGSNEMMSEIGEDLLGMVGLRQHALTLFITHYPTAHEQIKIKPLDQREPNLVTRASSRSTPEEENLLNYWREDSQLNEHHGRWHEVNPLGGRPGSQPSEGTPPMTNRNGELFAYMHLQMLARYDAERLCAGLSRVQAFDDDYTKKIPEGYDPGKNFGKSSDDGKEWVSYRARPANAQIRDLPADGPVPASLLKDLVRYREALREAARQGTYQVDGDMPVEVSSDNFGNSVEASVGTVGYEKYGNLHGDGHAHISFFFDGTAKPPVGVLIDLYATCRDLVFWRWHKHIDTIIQVWRKTLGERSPHDFTKDAPKVAIRDEDIILCLQEGFSSDVDGKQLGATAFGYSDVSTDNRWDADFSSGSSTVTLSKGTKNENSVTVTTTDELLTEMRNRTIHPLKNPPDNTEPVAEEINYLSHDDFSYFIRLQNHSERPQNVTVRIFLAPEQWVDDSTAWIEMDRFLHQVEGGERAVVCRPSKSSAVIRKPAVGYEELEGTKPRESETSWCDCGWPYTLLLPRGTEEGLDFRLLVMLSGDDLTMDETGKKCTSMSYCGLQDELYPDKRPMGYPFDRQLPQGVTISSLIDKNENWASRTIRIRCRS